MEATASIEILETGAVSVKALVETVGSNVSVRQDVDVKFMRCMDYTANAQRVLRDACPLGSCQVFRSCACW